MDASYVVDGAASADKLRSRRQGMNGDLWEPIRDDHPPVDKVRAHATIEDVIEGRVEWQDYVGNALADAAAFVGAGLLAPSSCEQRFAEAVMAAAYHTALRIAWVEAAIASERLAEVPAPEWAPVSATSVDEALTALGRSSHGHVVARRPGGGLTCLACGRHDGAKPALFFAALCSASGPEDEAQPQPSEATHQAPEEAEGDGADPFADLDDAIASAEARSLFVQRYNDEDGDATPGSAEEEEDAFEPEEHAEAGGFSLFDEHPENPAPQPPADAPTPEGPRLVALAEARTLKAQHKKEVRGAASASAAALATAVGLATAAAPAAGTTLREAVDERPRVPPSWVESVHCSHSLTWTGGVVACGLCGCLASRATGTSRCFLGKACRRALPAGNACRLKRLAGGSFRRGTRSGRTARRRRAHGRSGGWPTPLASGSGPTRAAGKPGGPRKAGLGRRCWGGRGRQGLGGPPCLCCGRAGVACSPCDVP